MNFRLALVLVLLCYLVSGVARAGEAVFNILDQWDCGDGLKCSIAIDPQERFVLLTTRGNVLVTVVHRGKVIYQEPKPKEEAKP
jgi:hypothetical protein